MCTRNPFVRRVWNCIIAHLEASVLDSSPLLRGKPGASCPSQTTQNGPEWRAEERGGGGGGEEGRRRGGEEGRRGGGEEGRRGGGEEGVKTVNKESRNAGWDYEDGEMSLTGSYSL